MAHEADFETFLRRNDAYLAGLGDELVALVNGAGK